MTALNFSPRFAPLVAARTKRQTIRTERSAARFKVGGRVRPTYLTLGGPGYPQMDIDDFGPGTAP